MIANAGRRRTPLSDMMKYECGVPLWPPTKRRQPEERNFMSDVLFPYFLPAVFLGGIRTSEMVRVFYKM